MPIRPIALKILFGVIVFSLVIPFSPSVSLAKAKMCCKIKCSKMMQSLAKPEQKPTNHCNHKKGPINCCNENCSKIITYEKSVPISILGTRLGIESPQKTITFLSVLSPTSIQPAKFPITNHIDSYRYKIKNPPIFITVSSFLI